MLSRPSGATAVLGVVAALLLSGCGGQPDKVYGSGDGAVVVFDDTVVVASLLVVAGGPDTPGALIARVVNTGDQDRQITFTGDEGQKLGRTFDVPAGKTFAVGGVDPGSVPVVIDPTPAPPGRNAPMTLSLDSGESEKVKVPVLSWDFARYQPYQKVAQTASR